MFASTQGETAHTGARLAGAAAAANTARKNIEGYDRHRGCLAAIQRRRCSKNPFVRGRGTRILHLKAMAKQLSEEDSNEPVKLIKGGVTWVTC
jgi:hypothetical protein